MRIGVFDSGVGGLTVLKAIHQLLPQVDLIYFGDSIHLPYGNKSPENILRYSLENYYFLLREQVELVVIACNTSSAIARKALERKKLIPVVGVIQPGVEMALSRSPQGRGRIIIASTFRTMNSHVYRNEIKDRNPLAEVIEVACPSLVSLIEEGFEDQDIIIQVLQYYLAHVVEGAETLVLGCTHYPLIKDLFKLAFPWLNIVDSAEATAATVKKLLSQNDHFNFSSTETRTGNIRICTNDGNETFRQISKKIFPSVRVELISTD